MNEPKDCTVINGDVKVVISRSTAEIALQAIKKRSEVWDYKGLLADDASFLRAAIEELTKSSDA